MAELKVEKMADETVASMDSQTVVTTVVTKAAWRAERKVVRLVESRVSS